MGSRLSEQEAVVLAKNKLRLASAQVDYFAAITNPVKQHPLTSVGVAFAAGIVASRVSKKGSSTSLIGLLISTIMKL